MLKSTIALFIFLTPLPNECKCLCGLKETFYGRIFNGYPALHWSIPWQILIQVITISAGIQNERQYGGVLISEKHVVTCAKCMENFFARYYWEMMKNTGI